VSAPLQAAIPPRKARLLLSKGKRGSGYARATRLLPVKARNLIDKLFDEVYALTVNNSVLNI
jgi:hypothetical protein